MFSRFLPIVLILVLSPGPASAAEVGRSVLDGREIILNDDNTWQYSKQKTDASTGDCTRVSSDVVPFSLCLDSSRWTGATLGGEQERSIKHKQHELYIMLISERVFIESSVLRDAAISNAQAAAGLEKVNIIDDVSIKLDSHQFGKLVYQTKVDGLDITYQNLYTNFEDIGSLQLVFFAASSQYDEFEPLMSEAVSSITINR